MILFLDNLFDSLNGKSKAAPSSKPLKGAVNRTSEHENFWNEALAILKTMKFYCVEKKKFIYVPSLKNLCFSLEGMKYLTRKLLQQKDFSYVMTGSFNQDPLENFFSYMRSHGCRNVNPGVFQFISSFKSLLVNNFMSAHSPYSNCQPDSNDCLDNLRSFLLNENIPGVHNLDPQPVAHSIGIPQIVLVKKTKVARCITSYISGYVARYLLNHFGKCNNCKENITYQDKNVSDHDYIIARQYKNSKLTKAGTTLNIYVIHCLEYLFYLIPRQCHEFHISLKLYHILKENVNITPLNCPLHDISTVFYKFIIRCALFWWCRSINKILKGKDNKFTKFLLTKPNSQAIDPIKLAAHKKYNIKIKRRANKTMFS